jgi:ABC-type sugar transport system substrate-binding protein
MVALMSCNRSSGQAPVPAAPETDKAKIGVLLPSLSFDFQAQMAAGVKRAAAEKGYGYQEVDYNFDAELQLSGAETLAASGVLAYYGIFLNLEAGNVSLTEHPEVAVISQAMDVDANAFMLNDYKVMGQQFVESLDYFRKENNVEGGQIAAIWLTGCEVVGTEFNTAMVDMKNIMTEYCKANGLEFVSDQFADTDEQASNITEQLLNAYPKLRYMFCFNNGFALVAANEIMSAVPDAGEYFVFSSEGDPESFRTIKSGTSPYRACAYNNIEQSGYEAGLQLVNWIENGKIENVVVTRTLVDSRNIQDFLP